MARKKNQKICVVCGKPFECPPSSKKITCSKECSYIRKSNTHKGKSARWSDACKEKLSEKGQTENLKKGTAAAQNSPKSGRFVTNVNAKTWHLVSPSGKHYTVTNLLHWCRGNCELFDMESTEENARRISGGIRHAKAGTNGKKYAKTCTYKGWRVDCQD